MFVSYVERCTDCACSSLVDATGRAPLPGTAACGRCRCHTTASRARAVAAAWSADAARARLLRRRRGARVAETDLAGPALGR